MNVPKNVRDSMRGALLKLAGELGWDALSPVEKARYYERWTRDSNIGGVLDRYMDRGQVRVYIKDSLLKDFGRTKLADPALPMQMAGIGTQEDVAQSYIKPHGRRTADGRIVCWGRAEDWKSILMAAHERAYVVRGTPTAVILTSAIGRYLDSDVRALVDDAARKLCIEKLIWLD